MITLNFFLKGIILFSFDFLYFRLFLSLASNIFFPCSDAIRVIREFSFNKTLSNTPYIGVIINIVMYIIFQTIVIDKSLLCDFVTAYQFVLLSPVKPNLYFRNSSSAIQQHLLGIKSYNGSWELLILARFLKYCLHFRRLHQGTYLNFDNLVVHLLLKYKGQLDQMCRSLFTYPRSILYFFENFFRLHHLLKKNLKYNLTLYLH